MKKEYIWVIIALIVLFLSFFIYKTITGNTITGNTISLEECEKNPDDGCWHSLAHQTSNWEFCDKIENRITREHCIGHE